MVTIKIYVEGQSSDYQETKEALTISDPDYSSFAKSFNKLLNSAFDDEKVQVKTISGLGYTCAAKKVKLDSSSLGLIDLDYIYKSDKSDKLSISVSSGKKQFFNTDEINYAREKIKSNNLVKGILDRVFFMVQAMESWILSQPEVITKVYVSQKINKELISENPSLKGINCETIVNPDEVLDKILNEYFWDKKKGKKLKYIKGKNAYLFIEKLDINKLRNDFSDVEMLLNAIKLRSEH